MACTSVGVHAAGVSNVATYSHLLGSSTFCSFSVLPHFTDTCAKVIKQFQCIIAVENDLSQGDSSSDDATVHPVVQYNVLRGCRVERSLIRLPKGIEFFVPFPVPFLFGSMHC